MRSVLGLMTLVILGNFNAALASRCKPHPPSITTTTDVTTTANPTSSETEGPLIVKNEITGGNFATRGTVDNPVPGFSVEGEAQILLNKGYTGDGSKDQGCVELSASGSPSGRKRAVGNAVRISQQVGDLNTKKKYTVRFFYAAITTSSVNVCEISASIGRLEFYKSNIISSGQVIQWATVLTQTDVPSTEGAFSLSVTCPVGGIAVIYVDSIFMSNQVTPDTIDDVAIDFGNGGSVPTPPTTSSPATVSPSTDTLNTQAATNNPSTMDAPPSATYNPTSDADQPVSDVSTSFDVHTFGPSTISANGPSTASFDSPSTISMIGPSTLSMNGPPTMSLPATEDMPTGTESDVRTLTRDPPTTATYNPVSTASSLPSGSRVCPAGAPPPGYCTPVQPEVTQMVSLPGHKVLSDNELGPADENSQPDAARACWAYGVPKVGTWGRAKWSNPRQNSMADCALLCKKEGNSCKAFALNTLGQETSCSMLGDRLGVAGIDLDKQRSLIWNDFDCFECQGCEIANPADISTASEVAPSSVTYIPEHTVPTAVMTSVTPSATSCPTCHKLSSPSSDFICEQMGSLDTSDFSPYTTRDFDRETLQQSSLQCAVICFQLDGCAASAYDDARRRCIFSNAAFTTTVFQEAVDQSSAGFVLPWSSLGCWSCSNDCSIKGDGTSEAFSSTPATATQISSEHTTVAPSSTEPPTTLISSYVPTTTESEMPQCTLALSDGCSPVKNYKQVDCDQSGSFRNTFTLRDEEYLWQVDTNHCSALCFHMPHRCKASAWSYDLNKCVFSSRSIHDSSFTPGYFDESLDWSEQSCYKCFCTDRERDDYLAEEAAAPPEATCAPSITSEEAVCQIKDDPSSDLVCQHEGYFPWAYDEVPSKFPNQDSEERCAALCNANPDCVASAYSKSYGKCAIGYHQLKYIQWDAAGSRKLSWSDKGCWDCSDCIKSQTWRVRNV